MLNKLYFDSNIDTALISSLVAEKKYVGYYALPYQNTNYIDNYITQIDKKIGLDNITDVVIVGIGGSSLGIRSVYHFIKSANQIKKNMHFIGSTDPIAIKNTLNCINIETTHFIVISKSGVTLETIATYKYLLGFIDNKNFSFITDKESPLAKHAAGINAVVVNIQANISGRFSVFSSVGMIPLALVGIDIKKLLQGAKEVDEGVFSRGRYCQELLIKAYFYSNQHDKYHINTLFSYSDSLYFFNQWFVQLWGESLGKKQLESNKRIGLTPIGLIGPKDQHSFLQLIADGNRDKTITFIKIMLTDKLSIPNISLKNLHNLDYINNLSFAKLINIQADSVIQSLIEQQGIAVDEIILKKQDEIEIGKLMFYYQILTSMTGILLNINTYNQPGVERCKQILKKKLNKK